MKHVTVPSPEETSARLSDPVKLRTDWDDLRSSRAHLHNPEAARILGVPEAALVASRLGSGALRLPADPLDVLSPITEWRRVLVAVHNALGVSLALGQVKEVAQEGDAIRLTGPHLHTEFSAASVANAFWFVEVDDSHGRTRSLQFSDAGGNDIIKVFLFHKTAAANAERRFKGLGETIAQTPFAPAEARDPSHLFTPDRDHPGVTEVLAADAPQAFRTALSQLGELNAPVHVDTFALRAAQSFRGRVTHARIDEVMAHLHEPDIRMHLRPGVLQAVHVRRLEGRIAALEFTDPTGLSLRLSSPQHALTFSDWAQNVTETMS